MLEITRFAVSRPGTPVDNYVHAAGLSAGAASVMSGK